MCGELATKLQPNIAQFEQGTKPLSKDMKLTVDEKSFSVHRT